MAIQHRRGIYDRFDPSRLVAGEWAIVLSGDTSASDGRAAYICFAAGTVKRIATYEDMAESIANANEELIEELTAQITAATTAANTAASNANTKATAANTAASSANTAASAANTAASNANSKATAANTAASSANSAASSATTAAGRANTAADAANAAATSATEAAESVSDAAYRAETAATSANTAAGSANAAAQRANTAADSANAATSEANAAIEAMGDISELAVPEMTSSVRGGAKVGGSTQVVDEKLEIKLSESATGTSITTGSTSAMRGLQVYGKSVQDGTPTPDTPAPVQVVEGANVWHESVRKVGVPYTNVGITWVKNADGTYTANGNATANAWAYAGTTQAIIDMAIPLAPGRYTATTNAQRCTLKRVSGGTTSDIYTGFFSSRTFTVNDGDSIFICPEVPNGVEVANETYYVQIVPGSNAFPYVPYGFIGIVVGDAATPIDLQGNTLASLPDGTRDELHVDSAGRVWIEKNIYTITLNGGAQESWGDGANGKRKSLTLSGIAPIIRNVKSNSVVPSIMSNRFVSVSASASYASSIGVAQNTPGTYLYINLRGSEAVSMTDWIDWLAANPVTVYYPLETPQTIDLGYIDPPAIPSGSVVTISASLTPTFDLACWTEHASELAYIPDAITTFAEVIYDKQESIASSIAPVEGSTASANHAVDDYLMLGARLYRVTTAIASGERIIPGTNVTETTVMAEIVSLLS